MMRLPTKVLCLLAVLLWISAIGLFAAGMSSERLAVLRYAAIPDALIAVVATAIVVRRWSLGT